MRERRWAFLINKGPTGAFAQNPFGHDDVEG
jgi:hypothetical protein